MRQFNSNETLRRSGLVRSSRRRTTAGKRSIRFLLLNFTALALLPVLPAAAQNSSNGTGSSGVAKTEQIETVTVSANKRQERLLDVATSVTALSATELKATGNVRLQDYMEQVPGLSVDDTSGGGGLSQVYIRGVTTGQGGNPTVGFYIDDTPFGSSTSLGLGAVLPPDLDPSDVQQVEVLRGPQGTLYGAGSMGGLIKYVTPTPETDRYFGRLEVGGSAVDGGGTGYSASGMANVPLTDDVAVRVSGFMRSDPGYIDNKLTGQENVNSSEVYGGHVSLFARLDQNWTLRLSALVQNLSNDGSGSIDVDSTSMEKLYGSTGQSRAYGTGTMDASYGLYSVKLDGDLGWATFESISSFGRLTTNGLTDMTSEYGTTVDSMLGVTGANSSFRDKVGMSKVTQELRLVSPTDQRLSWQFGIFYTNEGVKLNESMPTYYAATGESIDPGDVLLETYLAPSRYEEVAAYGDVTYKITDKFDVTGGVRFSYNAQQAHETYDGEFMGGADDLHLRSNDSAVTFLFSPSYHFDQNTMAYFRIASGYRPGGPNIVITGVSPHYDSDSVINYEVGMKGDLLDSTITYDVAAFYIDWSSIQLRQVSDLGTQYFGNAGKATSKGVEASVVWSPIDGLDLSGNATYTDATLGKDTPSPLMGVKGDPLPYTPKWSGRIGADYHFPVGIEWVGDVGVSYRYVGTRYADFTKSSSYARYNLGNYSEVSANIGIRNDDWSLTLYAKNLNNSHGQTSAYQWADVQQVSIIRPRTFGVSLSRNF